MLPFLKPKYQTGIITKVREPDGNMTEDADDQSDDGAGLKAAAADLIRAVHAKDEDGTVSALRAAFELLEMEPHEEGEHISEEQEQE